MTQPNKSYIKNVAPKPDKLEDTISQTCHLTILINQFLTTPSTQGSEVLVVDVHRKKIFTKSKQSIFQLAFQKQGLKQPYHTLRKGSKRCPKLTKDEGR